MDLKFVLLLFFVSFDLCFSNPISVVVVIVVCLFVCFCLIANVVPVCM